MKWSCGYQLRIRSGPNRGLTYIVDAPVLKIGRSIRPGERVPGWIKVNDDTVSRLHCELFWQDDRQCFRLLHRSTTNSSYVNGEEVEDVKDAVIHGLWNPQKSLFPLGGLGGGLWCR